MRHLLVFLLMTASLSALADDGSFIPVDLHGLRPGQVFRGYSRMGKGCWLQIDRIERACYRNHCRFPETYNVITSAKFDLGLTGDESSVLSFWPEASPNPSEGAFVDGHFVTDSGPFSGNPYLVSKASLQFTRKSWELSLDIFGPEDELHCMDMKPIAAVH
jgi:hypothetical protein